MEQSDDVEQKTSPPSESIELEQLSEDEDKLTPEILIKEKVQASPKLKNVPQISKTQSLLPTLQTASANIEGTNKKMRQSQPSLPIPSDVSDLTTSGTKPSSAMNDLKADYNIEELRMRLKERPSASEDESGLSRMGSHSSRMTRAVRQLFCCGVPVAVASDENFDSPRDTSAI